MANQIEVSSLHSKPQKSLQIATFIAVSILVLILAAMYLGAKHATNYPLGYYHLAMAKLYATHGFIRQFPTLPFSDLATHFADQHLLFNLLLSPFALLIDDPLLATSTATLVWLALVCLAVGILFAKMKLRFPTLLLLLLFLGIMPFAERLLMPRPVTASVFFLVLFLHTLYQRKKVPIFIVSLIYGWLYHASLQIIPIAFLYFFLVRLREGKWVSTLLLAPVLGFSVSLVLNPTFPNSITFLVGHTLFLSHSPVGVAAPAEWHGLSIFRVLTECTIPLILLGIAMSLHLLNRKIPKVESLHLLALCVLYFAATVHSVRFFEYFGLFPILAVGFLLSEETARKKLGNTLGAALLAVALIAASMHTIPDLYNLRQKAAFTPERMKGVTQYLKANVEKGSVIFNVYSGDFSELLYYAPEYRYTEGANHSLMAYYDADLYKDFILLLRKPNANANHIIVSRFNSHYVVISKLFSGTAAGLLAQINTGQGFEIVYKDENALVAKVVQ